MTNKEFFLALDDLETQKGISKDEFIKAFEEALASAYRHETSLQQVIKVELAPEKKTIKFFVVQTVVEEVTNPVTEIALSDAVEVKKGIKVGDELKTEIVPKDFSRVAAQTVKQVVTQKLRDIEKANTLNEFEDRAGEVLTGVIRRIDEKKNTITDTVEKTVYVEIGAGQIEGVLMPKDQLPHEKYEVGQKLNVYVKRVRNSDKNAQIIVSRTSTGLIRRLFENEVPEIRQGVVQIKSVAREAGQRTKIAIYSDDPTVDAIGACVGLKGVRINPIIQELGGEKIDIILWSDDPLRFIAKALSPADVIKVIQLDEKSARAVVPDDKLSLAIGRNGQNARLAALLTGWKIDVKSESSVLSLGEE